MQTAGQSSTFTLPLSAYIEQLRDLDGLGHVVGKPQSLNIVGDQLYWLQGIKQELYVLSLNDVSLSARRIMDQGEDEARRAHDELRSMTKEEELLRERQRTRVTGISGYHVRPADGAVFFRSGMGMFLYRPSSASPLLRVFDYIKEDTWRLYFSAVKKPLLNLQYVKSINVCQGAAGARTEWHTLITFVYNSNLFIATVVEQDDTQAVPLDVQIEPVTMFGDALHECGTADYIMQEEFDRYTGHCATEHHVFFSYTDTSTLRSLSLMDTESASGVEEMRYCRVGDPNARSLLVVYERRGKRFCVVPHEAVAAVAPWAEYIPRFGFKDDETIYFSLLSRTQERYCVLSCRIDALPEVETCVLASYFDANAANKLSDYTRATATTIPFITEWEQHIPWAWVEVMPGPPILFGPNHDVLLAHAVDSETAHCHLHVRDWAAGTNGWRQLTQGNWNVKPGSVTVLDDQVVFIANAHNKLGSALFSVSLSSGVEAVSAAQLTPLSPSNEHVYSFTAGNGKLCYVAGTATTPPRMYTTTLHSPAKRCLVNTEFRSGEEGGKNKNTLPPEEDLVKPKTITIVNRRGVSLGGRLFISPTAVAGKPAPLLMYVYGGPHVQLVYEDDYDLLCKPLFQLLVRHGISVLVADGQMSKANGLRDHSICKHNMGNFETSDYVDFAKHMTTSPDLPGGFTADPSRIAIFGWSYGGYATLLAMSQASDVFKLGFAGAPVGDWTLYDTGYTERYMGELYAGDDTNPQTTKSISKAYTRSAIQNFASGFPDDLNRVFIAHGILDENVHFAHTSSVVTAMIDAGKPYIVFPYPGERHGLRQKITSKYHHEAMLTKTIVEFL